MNKSMKFLQNKLCVYLLMHLVNNLFYFHISNRHLNLIGRGSESMFEQQIFQANLKKVRPLHLATSFVTGAVRRRGNQVI